MVSLSNRLNSISEEIKRGETMADIGTDHGFLPIYLWEEKISPHVIMTDVSQGSLEKARQNCIKQHKGINFDLRQGNGLEVLEKAEVDVIVIAGMGGLLIIELMEKNLIKTKSYKKFILQPRSAIGELREWLYCNDFSIEKEKLVLEGKFICEILTVSTEKKETPFQFTLPVDKIQWQVPKYYKTLKSSLREDFILRKLKKEEIIFNEKLKSNSANIESTEKNIEYLKELLEDK